MPVAHLGGDSVSRCPANSELFCRSRGRQACIDEFVRRRNRLRIERRSTRLSATFSRSGDTVTGALGDVPDIVPMPFASRQWRALVADNAKTARRTYETAVVATLRDRLRAGDAWVEGSRDYRRFDAYLPPAHDAERVFAESGIETDAGVWLARRREWLHERLGEVGAKLARGQLEGVRLENARVRITPHDAVTPPAAERLDRAIDALMPRIRIPDLLWEVNSRTGFLDAFTDLRSGRVHSNRAAILATVLAGATNLGLERMAHASSGVSHAQLSWAHAWHLRTETYADALARIIDAHHALPFARVWGSRSLTSDTIAPNLTQSPRE